MVVSPSAEFSQKVVKINGAENNVPNDFAVHVWPEDNKACLTFSLLGKTSADNILK